MCAVCATDLNESKTSDEALLSAGLHQSFVTGAVGDGGSDAVALQNAAKIIPAALVADCACMHVLHWRTHCYLGMVHPLAIIIICTPGEL